MSQSILRSAGVPDQSTPAPINGADEIRLLRRTIRDVVALSTLPAVWIGLGLEGVARSLADVLQHTLSLELIYVRMAGSADAGKVEILRTRHAADATAIDTVKGLLAPLLKTDGSEHSTIIPNPFGVGVLHLAVTRFGVSDDHSILITGSRNTDFPNERDRVLLSVGASQTAIVIQRRRAEQQVREQEQRTKVILESITDAFCALDRNWRFTYVNRQAEFLLSRSRDELIGRDHWQEYPDTIGTDLERNYRRAVAENVTVIFDMFYPPHDRWYEIHAYPSPDGLSVYFRDISERKRAEEALREGERRWRSLAEALPNLVWTDLPDGQCDYLSSQWGSYTGIPERELLGLAWLERVIHPEDRKRTLECWMAAVEDKGVYDVEYRIRRHDGEYRWFKTRGVPVRDPQGHIVKWFGTCTDIEDQKQSQAALARSERHFRQLADAMPQIVWTAGPEGNIDYLNRRWIEFTGLPDTIGNEGWGALLHLEDAPIARDRWAVSVESGTPFEMEVRLLDRRQKAYRWHLIRTVAVHDETGKIARWYGTSTDIHEQKRTAESAQYVAAASGALAAVVDYESTLTIVANLAVPYFADWSAVDVLTDGNLRRLSVAHQDPEKIQLANELMLNYPPDLEAPGGIGAVLRTGNPEIVADVTDELLVRGAKDERHLRMIRSLGLKSYICVPLIVSGKPFGVLTFATAESGRRYTDADLALAKDLADRSAVAIENTQLYLALRDADRRKDEFLATLAHELRNPLAPIRNSLQILKMPRVDAETVERSREMMERQVQHLVRLVDDLLDVSRVMRGKIELRKEQVELATVVARAVELVQPLMDAQGHDFKIQIPSESLLLNADPVRLVQVIGNLLTNAAKYTEPNGRIGLTAKREDNAAVLHIRDNGIGIAPDMLPHVFELFVQADYASTRSQGGLGIGLTLVKNLVEMHNGNVEARSNGLGTGSEFVVSLPISVPVHADHGSVGLGRPAYTVSSLGRRLLVIDDNQDAANSLAMLLRLEGHDVRAVFSGEVALEMVKDFIPDMVFLDLGMPGMDGYEVARQMRKNSELEQVLLVALTGWGQHEDRRRTAEAGFDHHLVKPPDLKELERILSDVKRSSIPSLK